MAVIGDFMNSRFVMAASENHKIKACDCDKSMWGRNSLRSKTKVNEYLV